MLILMQAVRLRIFRVLGHMFLEYLIFLFAKLNPFRSGWHAPRFFMIGSQLLYMCLPLSIGVPADIPRLFALARKVRSLCSDSNIRASVVPQSPSGSFDGFKIKDFSLLSNSLKNFFRALRRPRIPSSRLSCTLIMALCISETRKLEPAKNGTFILPACERKVQPPS